VKHEFKPADFGWNGIEPVGYKASGERDGDGFRGVTKHVISGNRGEPCGFELRYFEVEPGGHTRLEQHKHVHSITVVRGSGYAVVGDAVHPLRHLDHVYVAPMTLHQFVNDGDEPFGFMCIVDSPRDRPQKATPEDVAALERGAATAGKIRS
jgi:quercetin dioxygenase-like cupin family protein